MKMRSLMSGMIAAGLATGVARTRRWPVRSRSGSAPTPTPTALPKSRSTVHALMASIARSGTKTLDYIVSVRGDRPKKATGDGDLEIQFKKESPLAPTAWGSYVIVHGDVTKTWKHYKVSIPYVDPWSRTIVNEKVSPIEFCNDNLALRKKNPDRRKDEAMLNKGLSFLHHDAFRIRGYVHYPMKGSALFGNDVKDYDDVEAVPVKITCMPLDRPRPRKDTSTTGAPGPKGKPMPPTVSKATIRIEPAKVVQDGKFLCPSQLKLYGHVEVIREFYGKALFVGPHYLSAITTLNFQAKGSRNVDRHLRHGLAQDGRLHHRTERGAEETEADLPLQRRRQGRQVAQVGGGDGRSELQEDQGCGADGWR